MILMHNWFCVDAAAGRLEPKGEAEVLEVIIVSDAVEGTFVKPGWQKPSGGAQGKVPKRVDAVNRS